ncbi:MAG: FAD-dependent oxidoreductase, partial [Planctomycetaceae bacterium]|nr:FAD-dependent oxidoreductase [Planctomycetaceae bacterium]
MNSGRVIVVGGGVIGAACAYFLKKAGWDSVTVLDRGQFGKACSHGNCGFVSPSHVLPLTVPGAIGQTL